MSASEIDQQIDDLALVYRQVAADRTMTRGERAIELARITQRIVWLDRQAELVGAEVLVGPWGDAA